MQEIVIPVDFSEKTKQTVQYGIYLAGMSEMAVKMVHVVPIDYPGYGLKKTFKTETESPVIREQMEQTRKKFKDLTGELAKSIPEGVTVDFEVRPGFPADQVASLTEDEGTGLLLITNPENNDEIPGTGEDSLQVILDGSSCPVIILPSGKNIPKLNKILYATELHDADIQALRTLSKFAGKFHAQIDVIHINDDDGFRKTLEDEGFKQMIREKVEYPDIDIYNIPTGNIAKDISRYARNFKVGMISMIRENPDFWQRLMGKSTTERLLDESGLPVMIFNKNK